MSGFVFGSLCRMLAGQEIFYMTQKAREEVSAEDAKESAELTQQLAVGTLHSTMDLNDCELLLAPSGGPAWPIEPKDDFTGQKLRSVFCTHRFLAENDCLLPRQLRTNISEQQLSFSAGTCVIYKTDLFHCRCGGTTGRFPSLNAENDHFTKTGSGQT